MGNRIQKQFFKQENTGYVIQFIAEVRELGEYKGEPCINILMRELFYSKGRFRAMIPLLIAEWGDRLEIKKKVGGKYLHISHQQARLVWERERKVSNIKLVRKRERKNLSSSKFM